MSVRTVLLLVASLAALAIASGAADARPRPDGGPMGAGAPTAVLSGAALVFVSFDADGDYATSRAELETGIARETARAFDAVQTLSPISFQAWSARALGGPAMGPFRLAFDGNQDGQISRDEFAAAFTTAFADMDKDGDGRLARSEMVQRLPMGRGPGGAAPGGDEGERGGRRPPRGGPPPGGAPGVGT